MTQSLGPFLGIRHLQAFLLFLNIVTCYIVRLNVPVAVVAMTDAATTNPDFMEFHWTKKQKSYILSSFYWGYVVTQVLGGYLGKRFGTKIIMFISNFGSALFSLITPISVTWGGWEVFCAIRIMQGLFQGMMFPCIHEHLAKWSPLNERNRLGALSYTGVECGHLIALSISGVIAASALGWPGISYVSGGIAIVGSVVWLIFAADNATESKFITNEEKNYIESSLSRTKDFHEQKVPTPWRAIFTSVPFYALLVVRSAQSWGGAIMTNEVPSYLHGVLGMDIKSNALFSSLPYLVMWVLAYCFLIAADFLMNKKLLSLKAMRTTFNSIACWVPALSLIGVGFLNEQHVALAIALINITVGLTAGATIGSSLNTIDLSSNHAGVLMSIVNTVSSCMSILAPLEVGLIVTDTSDRAQWRIVFIVAALIYFVGNLVYIIWASTEAQPWNDPKFLLSKDVIEGGTDNKVSGTQSVDLPTDTKLSDKNKDNLTIGEKVQKF